MEGLLPKKLSAYKKLMRASWTLYRRSVLRVLPLSLLLAVTTFIPRLLSDLLGVEFNTSASLFSANFLWLMLVTLPMLIFFIGILWRMHCIIQNKHEPFIEDLTIGVKKFLIAFVANIVGGLFVIAAIMPFFGLQLVLQKMGIVYVNNFSSMLFTIAMVILQVLFTLYLFSFFIFLPALIAIENQGIIASFKRSVRLGWNHFWRIITVQITPWLCYFIALLIIKNMFNVDIHIYFTDEMAHTFLTTLFHLFLFAIFIPWVAATLLVQLNDLEIRNKLLFEKNA